MTLTETVAQRISDTVDGLGMVGNAADFASIGRETLKYPAAFVVPLAERGGPSEFAAGVTAQRREPRVGVILVVRNVRAAKGAAALADIEPLRGLVDAQLFGWQPTADHEPLLLASGKILSMQNGVLWWQDEYVTAFERR